MAVLVSWGDPSLPKPSQPVPALPGLVSTHRSFGECEQGARAYVASHPREVVSCMMAYGLPGAPQASAAPAQPQPFALPAQPAAQPVPPPFKM